MNEIPQTTAFPSPSQVLLRGFMRRCPNCGKGKLFDGYLKVVERCAACGEAYHHQRADDFPAYLTIFIVGHIVVTFAVWAGIRYDMSEFAQLALWIPVTVIATLLLLEPIKGVVVAAQWQGGMHGFAEAKAVRDAKNHPAETP